MCGPATELSDQLRSAIDLLEARVDELNESALGEELIELRLASDRIESIFSRCLLRFDATKGYAADGALSAVQWLKARCRLTAGAAVERLQVARRLAELPGANAAFALGQMGYNGINAVHVGKYLEIELNGADRETARRQLDEACRKFLSNPVIEDFRLEIE